MMLLDSCPMLGCRGELEPHCKSTTCDLVRCDRCRATGELDGSGWPRRRRHNRESRRFDTVRRAADQLLNDIANSEPKEVKA